LYNSDDDDKGVHVDGIAFFRAGSLCFLFYTRIEEGSRHNRKKNNNREQPLRGRPVRRHDTHAQVAIQDSPSSTTTSEDERTIPPLAPPAKPLGTAIAATFSTPPPPSLSLFLPSSFAVKACKQRPDDQSDNAVDNGNGHECFDPTEW
jgi:hypothetical protein